MSKYNELETQHDESDQLVQSMEEHQQDYVGHIIPKKDIDILRSPETIRAIQNIFQNIINPLDRKK